MQRVIAIVLVLALGGSARAEEIVGILEVEAEGVSETAAAAFERSIEEGLAGAGLRVAPRERVHDLLLGSTYVDGCVFGPCLEQVLRLTELRLVLSARITGAGSSYSFVVSLVDTRTGQTTSQVAERCSVCTLEEAISTATLSVIALVTGTGAAIIAPSGDPIVPLDPLAGQRRLEELEARSERGRRGLRRAALFFLGAAVVVGGVSAYSFSRDADTFGWGSAAAGGAFALTSGTLLVLSRRF